MYVLCTCYLLGVNTCYVRVTLPLSSPAPTTHPYSGIHNPITHSLEHAPITRVHRPRDFTRRRIPRPRRAIDHVSSRGVATNDVRACVRARWSVGGDAQTSIDDGGERGDERGARVDGGRRGWRSQGARAKGVRAVWESGGGDVRASWDFERCRGGGTRARCVSSCGRSCGRRERERTNANANGGGRTARDEGGRTRGFRGRCG